MSSISKLPIIAVALAVVGTTATASAQSTTTTTTTTVERVRPASKLSPQQRTVIYRTVTKERHVTPAPRVVVGERAVEERAPPIVVGQRIPPSVALAPVPESVYIEEPTMPRYKYYYVNNQVVLVDPATSEVIEVLDQ